MSRVLVFGAGEYARWIANTLDGMGVSIEGLLVQEGAVGSFREWPIWHISDCQEDLSSLPVVLGIFNPQTNPHHIVRDLRQLGFKTFVTPPSLFRYLAERGAVAQRYWLATDDLLIAGMEDTLNEVDTYWDDSESTSIFANHLLYRSTGALCYSWTPRPVREQYADPHVMRVLESRPGLVVDCGAFIGDSIENWAAHGMGAREVLAIEPESGNLVQLRETVARLGLEDCRILEAGVGSSTGKASLRGGGISARLEADPNGDLSVVSLDDILDDYRVCLIKMDIEGAELSALEGAARAIARDMPILAISVYHTPTDWWRVPQAIAAWGLDYSFHLRSYGHQGYDTVLYAIP